MWVILFHCIFFYYLSVDLCGGGGENSGRWLIISELLTYTVSHSTPPNGKLIGILIAASDAALSTYGRDTGAVLRLKKGKKSSVQGEKKQSSHMTPPDPPNPPTRTHTQQNVNCNYLDILFVI